jgi:hypothetical protein
MVLLIVKPASAATLTDHVFNTPNNQNLMMMISLRNLPQQHFLKPELHETLHAKMWSSPSTQVEHLSFSLFMFSPWIWCGAL